MNFLNHHLALRSWLQWPFLTPPPNWSKGTKGHVILIPGFASTWNFLKHLGDIINLEGYQVHRVNRLDLNIYSIPNCLSKIKLFIQEKNLDRVILMGHSKGGLVACLALNDSFLEKKIIKVISIATPFKGNRRAKKFRRVLNLHELTPNSEVLESVNDITPINRQKIINLYPRIDRVVFPKSSQLLSGAKNIEIAVSGHTRILESPKTFAFLKELFK